MHRDYATLTLNLALSDAEDFEGGGTRFEGRDGVVRPARAGACVAHAGRTRHAGAATTSGTRYVLVCFLLDVEADASRLVGWPRGT